MVAHDLHRDIALTVEADEHGQRIFARFPPLILDDAIAAIRDAFDVDTGPQKADETILSEPFGRDSGRRRHAHQIGDCRRRTDTGPRSEEFRIGGRRPLPM